MRKRKEESVNEVDQNKATLKLAKTAVSVIDKYDFGQSLEFTIPVKHHCFEWNIHLKLL